MERTLAVGEALGRLLVPGVTVGLVGPLGAGKTALARGIARGCGVPATERVTSPTFCLVNLYRGHLLVVHIDGYRIDPLQLEALGVLGEMGEEAVYLVEWADRVAGALPPDRYRVELEHLTPTSRRITLLRIGNPPPLKGSVVDLLPPGEE